MPDIGKIPIGDQRPAKLWWRRYGRTTLVVIAAVTVLSFVTFAIIMAPPYWYENPDSRSVKVTGFRFDQAANTFDMVFDQSGVYGRGADMIVMQRAADSSYVWLVTVPYEARDGTQQNLPGRFVDAPGGSTIVLITTTSSGEDKIREPDADGVKTFPGLPPGAEEYEVMPGSVSTTIPGDT